MPTRAGSSGCGCACPRMARPSGLPVMQGKTPDQVAPPDRALFLANLRRRWRLPCAVLAGAGMALAAAPFDVPWAVALIIIVFHLVVTAPTPSMAGWTAWWAALGYFGLSLNWIVEPFLVDAALTGWMAPFALVGLAGGLALFWALAGWSSARLLPAGALRAVAFAGLLALLEYARGFMFTGFPWAQPGHLLIAWDGVFPILAALGGAGLMTVVVLTLGVIGTVLLYLRPIWPIWVLLAVIASGPFVAGAIRLPDAGAAGNAPVVRLIQPNAPQHLKWRADMIPVFFDRALDLTAVPGSPDLVVWPETALPVLFERSDAVRARMRVAAGDAQIIVGGQRFVGFQARNTLALLDAEGQITAIYDKHHLVPFGEYMPFGAVLARYDIGAMAAQLAGGYSPGDGPAVMDLGARLGTVFPMICYEAIFPQYIRQVDRPDWIVHLTNDAWFGSFSGPYQHLALARLRAAEQGLPVLRAANTGVSAVIDARGRVLASLPLNTQGTLDARLPPALPPTVYARTGDWPVLIFVLLATGLALVAGRRRKAH